MWFKNLQLYRLTGPFALTADELAAKLKPQAFQPTGTEDMQSFGWVPPREGGTLVHCVNRQMLITLAHEKKLLPKSVITQVLKARAAEIEEQQGFKPGRKQMKELKEQVTDELVPRAFSVMRTTRVWIDPVNGFMAVDASSASKADEVFKLLLKSLDSLPFASLRTERSPLAAMTDWLAADEAPAGFTVDQDTELRATGEGKATVKYVRHTLEPEDVQRHISSGKQVTRLAMTWADRVSFVLTENMTIKRIAPLDVLKENTESTVSNEDERFDTDFVLMAGELAKLVAELIEALGGEGPPEKGQLDIDDMPKLAEQAKEGAALAASPDLEERYKQAVDVVMRNQRASISLIQRHLRIGYNAAARLIEMMEARGVVSAMDGSGNRTILEATNVE